MIVQITQLTPNPPLQYDTADLHLRGWYSQSFIAGDGVTEVEGGNGQTGFYYDWLCTQDGDGNLVIPALDVQATTESNPTASFKAQLYVDGAPNQMIIPSSPQGSGWAIPTTSGPVITFAELALYNRAKRLLYPPSTYWTADQVIAAILEYAGNFDYMAVGINGIGSIDTAPAVASLPVVIGTNSRRAPDFYNIIAFGAATTKTAAQNAAAIAVAVAAAAVTGGGIYVPVGTFVTNSVTISVPVEFALGASILSIATGQTVTITKTITADASKHFDNATAGLGTVSFSGNNALTDVWGEWWGALSSATATTNAAALNAANTALLTNTASGFAAGTINLGPGAYDINALVTLGSSVAFTGISLRGTVNQIGTRLQWTGSTAGTVMLWSLQRGSTIENIAFSNGVARGTTIGLRLSGPGTGTQTSGVTLNNVTSSNFHIAGLAGDGAGGGHDASEVTLIACRFADSDIGFQTDGFNTLNLLFYGCQFGSNTTGLSIGGGGAVHVYGGTWGQCVTGILLGGAATLFVSGVRDETDANGVFISSTAGSINAAITVIGCSFPVGSSQPMMIGAGAFVLIGNQFGSTAVAVKTWLGNSSSGNGASVTMIGNMVHDSGNLFEADASSIGATYYVSGNTKLFAGGGNGKWDDEEGIIDNSGVKIPTQKLSGLYTARFQDLFRLRLMSVAEGATLTFSVNTIAPTSGLHQVGAGLIKTITVPSGFASGTIALVPTAAFTYDATGNVLGTGTAVVGRTMFATYSASTGKWSMSY